MDSFMIYHRVVPAPPQRLIAYIILSTFTFLFLSITTLWAIIYFVRICFNDICSSFETSKSLTILNQIMDTEVGAEPLLIWI